MSDEYYEHFVHASAGSITAKLTIREGGDVECVLHRYVMGDQTQYVLRGRYEPRTEAYGWLRVERVTLDLAGTLSDLPIEVLGCELIYEVVKVVRSPVLEHPSDMLWMAARWNEFFDLLLFPIGFVSECYYGLKYMIDEDELDEYPPELRQHLNAEFMRHLENLVLLMDKMKFARAAAGA